jgi:putative ABC transport system substrate-binding protein
MRRREFVTLLGGMVVTSGLAAPAQERVARIGILLIGGRVAAKDLALSSELARLGYFEGRNIAYEVRAADGDLGRLPAVAVELVATKPDILVCATGAAAESLAAVTREIPIVVTVTVDAIAIGLSSSMSRPSRNITGFTSSTLSLAAKRLELLRELIPGLRKIAYLGGPPGSRYETPEQQNVHAAARALDIAAFSVPITTVDSVSEAWGGVVRDRRSRTGSGNRRGHKSDQCSGHWSYQ